MEWRDLNDKERELIKKKFILKELFVILFIDYILFPLFVYSYFG